MKNCSKFLKYNRGLLNNLYHFKGFDMKSKNSSGSFLWIVYNDMGIYGISFFREKILRKKYRDWLWISEHLMK